MAINKAHYKLRDIAEEVVEDMDKPLAALCDKLRTRQTKEETKSSIRAFLRTVCSSFVGYLNKNTSRCEENAIIQYPGEGTSWFQVLRMAMSDALCTGQELRYMVEEVRGDTNKPLSMLCAQPVTRLTKDEIKPSIQAILRIMCSSFAGNLNEHISMCEEHVSMQYPAEGTAWFQVLRRAMSDAICAEQELRYVVDMDKPMSMLCEQLGTRLTKDEAKPDTRYPLGFVVSRFQVLRRSVRNRPTTSNQRRPTSSR